jgi:hypothetical protein
MNFAPAEKIARTVLYEGYLLYPYRRSALKNTLAVDFRLGRSRGFHGPGLPARGDPGDAHRREGEAP